MKSSKQRRTEIKAERAARAAEKATVHAAQKRREREEMLEGKGLPPGAAPCNPALLAPYNSYGIPRFVERGYYVDIPFHCRDCGKEEVWRATQQKWWYEVAGGYVYSGASRCRSCRRVERERRTEARRVHLEGLAAREKGRQSGQPSGKTSTNNR